MKPSSVNEKTSTTTKEKISKKVPNEKAKPSTANNKKPTSISEKKVSKAPIPVRKATQKQPEPTNKSKSTQNTGVHKENLKTTKPKRNTNTADVTSRLVQPTASARAKVS